MRLRRRGACEVGGDARGERLRGDYSRGRYLKSSSTSAGATEGRAACMFRRDGVSMPRISLSFAVLGEGCINVLATCVSRGGTPSHDGRKTREHCSRSD